MLSSIVRILRLCGALFAAALILQMLILPAGAGERADFDAAVAQATARHANREAFGDRDYRGLFMQVDARIVGAMIVIDVGSRDAALEALAPIGETLSELNAAPTE
jgi:hypothetical protein